MSKIMPFGKFQGQTLESINATFQGREYISWLKKQQWCSKDRFKYLWDFKLDRTVNKLSIEEIRRLISKANNYNQQDEKKGRLTWDSRNNCWTAPRLSFEVILDIITAKGLKCEYCGVKTNICAKYKYDSKQFTLDRIDNDLTHTQENLLVCCFGCNTTRSNSYTVEEFRSMTGLS